MTGRARISEGIILGALMALGMAMLLLSASCSSGSDEASRPLVLWHSYRGAERVALEQVAARWNQQAQASHGRELRLVAVPYEAMADKITAAVPNGNGPDLFIFAHDRIGSWVEAGIVEPISYWVTDEVADRYMPEALGAFAYRQRLYGLPLAVKCVALFFNRKLVPVAPATTDELLAVGTRLTDDSKDRHGLAYMATQLYFHAAFLHGFGGHIFNDGGQIDMASPAAAKAAKFVAELARPGGMMPEEPNPTLITSLFNEGKVAMVINGPWFVGDIAKDMDYGIAPLPTVSETGSPLAPFLGVEGVIVSARSLAKQDAYRMAAALTDDTSAIMRVKSARQIVPNLAAYRDPEVAKNPVVSAFRAAALRARAMPSDPRMGSIWSPYDRALEKIVVLHADAAAALESAQGEAIRYSGAP